MAKKYARGSGATGECGRSGRKMLLKDMVFDGMYPNMRVDPAWYEPKHPQENLKKIEDPIALWRPAPENLPAPLAPVLSGELTSGGGENNSIRFDGGTFWADGEYARNTAAAAQMFGIDQSFTVEAWVRDDSANLDNMMVVGTSPPDTGFDLGGWALVVNSGVLTFFTRDAPINDFEFYTHSTTQVVPADTPTHIAAVVDRVAHTVTLYVNGAPIAAIDDDISAIAGYSLSTGDEYLSIGGVGLGVDISNFIWNYFIGGIDEVRLWNVARTAGEIAAAYDEPATGDEAGLVGLYQFDAGTGSTAIDTSPTGNDLTLHGGTWELPTFVTLFPEGGDSIGDLSWTEAVSGVSQVDTYLLYRSVNGAPYELLHTLAIERDFLGARITPLAYEDTPLTPGSVYSYYVVGRAVQGGDSPDSNIITLTEAEETFYRLLEDGSYRLLEDGSRRLLESAP